MTTTAASVEWCCACCPSSRRRNSSSRSSSSDNRRRHSQTRIIINLIIIIVIIIIVVVINDVKDELKKSDKTPPPPPSPSPNSPNSQTPFVKVDARVFIVGAGVGTGSIQNLTIRAANILKSADVVIYDDLGVDSEETLSLCGQKCKKIYVGKRGGRAEKNTSQAEINSLLVELSASGRYKHVVRLKGGDPTIFGRLGNEIEALKRAKIKYEIVPGVSSLVASAAAVGMPLTETMRGGKHFACISGHDAKTNPGV